MTDKSDRVLLRYEIDESALNRTIARANAARERISQIRSTLTQINQAAKPTGDALRKAFDDADRSASKLSQRLDEVARKRLRGTLPSQAQGLDDLRGSVSSRSGQSGINFARADSLATTTGRALRGLGQDEIGGLLTKAGDLAQLGDNLKSAADGTGAMAKAAQSLLPYLGPVAIGIGVAATAFGLLNAEMQKGKEAVQGYIEGQKAESEARLQAAKELKTLTSQQSQERAKDLQDRIAENNQLLATRSKQRDDTKRDLDDAIKNEDNLKIAALGQTFKQLDEDATRLTGESLKLKLEYIATTVVLGPLIKQREQEAEAIKKTQEARAAALELEGRGALRTADLIRTGTPTQIKQRLSAAKQDEGILQNTLVSLAAELGPDHPAVAAARKNLAELRAEIKSLAAALPQVTQSEKERRGFVMDEFADLGRSNELEGESLEARQRETEWLIKSTDAMNDFADEAERLSEERGLAKSREGQDFSIKRARDQAEFTRRTAESDSAYYKDRGKKIAAFNRDMADSDNEAQKARVKAVQEANDAQIRAAEDFARTVAGFAEQINDAGANLDAIGVRNAQRGLAAANDQYNTEKRRRDQDATKRIDEIAENAKAQKDARATAFAQELADADAEHAVEMQKERDEFIRRTQQEDQDRQLRLQRQQEDYARQDAQRRAAFDKQIQNLQTQLLYPEEQAKVASYGRQKQSLNDFLNGAVNDVNAAKSRVSTSDASRSSIMTSDASRSSVMTVASSNSSNMTMAKQSRVSTASAFSRGFAHGGRPPIGVPVMINEGRAEPVIFGSPAQVGGSAWGNGGGGMNFGDFYLNGGAAPEQYKAMVKEGIAEAFREAMN